MMTPIIAPAISWMYGTLSAPKLLMNLDFEIGFRML
jgi:hypothetical protein